ncbi:YibE/F family protein [Staphylococcus hyicus]|uniref:YibE/F family protein n=1 Tax=Staphylococcus hyicus TaxID=1284 RepID=UPI00057DD47D|nr:YibE/F family protein [Staphylococcus hyicus]AJC96990.1 YibE/YibF family protein [Staphylococcus hyicus]MCE5154060.1 YibE/F family protein [Staphylococcus hyicus]MCQ9301498.1 YibE/F family protein [Staphylococcus hyicus]RTX70296.1 YibE/F family protein [Staphylococcus hyicus]SQE49125.1 membrane protein [Staphylococcus hyicus]
MNAVVILGLILFLLMLIFGGKSGAVAFGTLFLNFILLVIALISMIFGIPIYIVTIIFCIVVAAINLFALNGFNIKTFAAFISSIVTTVMMLVAIYLSIHLGHLQGFTQEEQDETYIFSMNIGIDMEQFMIFVVILAVIAAVIDLAITISSPMYELHETNPSLSSRALFESGMRVGREILATSANTIYLAFIGGSMTLVFWFFNLHYHFGHLINAKLFVQELITILLGGIAIAICIPITAALTAWLIHNHHRLPIQFNTPT